MTMQADREETAFKHLVYQDLHLPQRTLLYPSQSMEAVKLAHQTPRPQSAQSTQKRALVARRWTGKEA